MTEVELPKQAEMARPQAQFPPAPCLSALGADQYLD